MAVKGVGFLIAENALEDVSYVLFESCVNTTINAFTVPAGYGDGGYGDGGYGDGTGLVVGVASTDAMYEGAQVIVGLGTSVEEVITILQVEDGDFIAAFVNAHTVGETVVGATFPVQNTAGDPLFLQSEMLGYLSNAINDFLLRVPLAYVVSTGVTVTPTMQFAALPSDCMQPVRVAAFSYLLRETSQSNLDLTDYRWAQQGNTEPYCYYRDKIGLQNVGVWPRSDNTTPLEIIYKQRSPETVGLADGFLIPDVFIPTIKARVLEFAYSKDGEQRAPALATFWNQRYENGVRIAGMFLEVIQATSQQ